MKEETIKSEYESLEIITDMINRTKFNVRQGSFQFLFWGWLISGISLGHFILIMYSDIAHPERIWLLTILGFVVSMVIGFRKGKEARVSTYADKIYLWIWMAYAITLTTCFIAMREQLGYVTPIILSLTGFATFLTGQVLDFKPLKFGGIIFWIFAILAGSIPSVYGLLLMALAVIAGYLIPGHLLKSKEDNVTF